MSEYLEMDLHAPREMVIRFGAARADPLRVICTAGAPCHWSIAAEPVPPGASVVGILVVELPETEQPTDLTVSVAGSSVRPEAQPNVDDRNQVTITLKPA